MVIIYKTKSDKSYYKVTTGDDRNRYIESINPVNINRLIPIDIDNDS